MFSSAEFVSQRSALDPAAAAWRQHELQQAEEQESASDVIAFSCSKMAEVSGLRSRNHFASNCKSRDDDEGKDLFVSSNGASTLRR